MAGLVFDRDRLMDHQRKKTFMATLLHLVGEASFTFGIAPFPAGYLRSTEQRSIVLG
jgi:hypothetical protein